jgi:ABC-2 type transport system permease protein
MNEIIAIAIKDLKLLIRDKTGFFFTFFFPVIVAVFFGTIFSGGNGETPSISILLVDEDQTPQSRNFISELGMAEDLDFRVCSRTEAIDSVRRGKSVAYIAVEPGFGAAQKNIFWGKPPQLELGVDPAQKSTAGMLQGILMKYAVKGFQQRFSDASIMRENIDNALASVRNSTGLAPERKQHLEGFLSELDSYLSEPGADSMNEGKEKDGFEGFQPLVIRESEVAVEKEGPQSGYAVSFPQGIMWGIIGCVASFSISLVVERTRGTLIRLRSAPVSAMQILAGKALACFLTTLVISTGLIILARVFFHLIPNSTILLSAAILSICLGFVGIMMLLSVLGKTEQAAGGIGWAILLMMSMLGGGMIPLFVMPKWLQNISHISPVKWAMLALEGAIWRRFTPGEMLIPCGVMLAVGIACFAAGLFTMRWMQSE